MGEFLAHYEACSWEFALIRAFGLDNLVNKINSTPFGDMRRWRKEKIINFGNMLIYNCFEKLLREEPIIHYRKRS